jgi:hypothetical protein
MLFFVVSGAGFDVSALALPVAPWTNYRWTNYLTGAENWPVAAELPGFTGDLGVFVVSNTPQIDAPTAPESLLPRLVTGAGGEKRGFEEGAHHARINGGTRKRRIERKALRPSAAHHDESAAAPTSAGTSTSSPRCSITWSMMPYAFASSADM